MLSNNIIIAVVAFVGALLCAAEASPVPQPTFGGIPIGRPYPQPYYPQPYYPQPYPYPGQGYPPIGGTRITVRRTVYPGGGYPC